ncbi:SAV_6107 family HEPN domain-containing protein [Streptomyces axinellae]|uniref:SAV-6107-like HEPN domain-containing protein n=1 Tax=Streptomyces axinellae TaxID=552788 RepID=A0ABN3PWE7_9ACTN
MRPSRGAHPAPPQPTQPSASRTDQVHDIHPVLRRATAPPAALDLLAQAQHGLDEAQAMETANERYATAHLAALRTAAAVLAVRAGPGAAGAAGTAPARGRGTPPRGPRRPRRPGIRSAWDVLPEVAPELAEWSALFASGAQRRARAEAGIKGAADWRAADDLVRDAGMFLRLAERMLITQPALPRPRVAPGDEQHTRHPPPGRRAG